jgi:hypothetical protein
MRHVGGVAVWMGGCGWCGWPAAVADGSALVSPAFGTGSGSGECVAVAVAVMAGCAVGWRSF